MRPVTVTNTATGATASSIVVVDRYAQPGTYAVQVTVSGTNTSKLQYTADANPSSGSTWFDYAAQSGYTTTGAAADLLSIQADTFASIEYVVGAWRLNTTAYTNGFAEMIIIQQGDLS